MNLSRKKMKKRKKKKITKYNTALNDEEIAKKVAQLIEEKVPENDR